MRRLFVLFALAACSLAEPAHAQDEPDSRQTCTWARARPASVEQVVANVRAWGGECVRVKALHAGTYGLGNRLLSDRMAALENVEPRQRSIVLNDRFGTPHEPHRPRWEEVLGTVGSCELAHETVAAIQAAEPDRIIMLSGLCHYTLDHFLVPLGYRDASGPGEVRLRRSELVPEQVELRELDPAHPIYPLRRVTGERMFAALEQRDFETFLALDQPQVARALADLGETGLGDADRKRLANARTDFDAAVGAYRASGVAPLGRSVMLFERWLDHEGAEPVVPEGADPATDAYWCRLREEAGDADLPVRAADIDNDPSRPFFCVRASDYVTFREGTVPSASVPVSRYGFLENAD